MDDNAQAHLEKIRKNSHTGMKIAYFILFHPISKSAAQKKARMLLQSTDKKKTSDLSICYVLKERRGLALSLLRLILLPLVPKRERKTKKGLSP